MNLWFIVMIVVYLGMLALVGRNSWKKTKSAEDYIMAGSKLGVMVGMLTFAATLFSTFTLLGMPEFFRTHGVGSWIFLAIADAAMFFLILWFGVHLRRAADHYGYQGMAGMLSQCYRTRFAGIVYFVGVFLFLVPYVAIQIRGIAEFLVNAFPELLPPWVWSLGIVCVMLLYSEFGGLRAIIHCDCIQGTILLIVIWIIAIGCVRSLGGVEAMFAQVRETNESLLSIPGPKGLLTPQFLIASFFAIVLIPVTQPQVTTRLVIIKNKRTMCHMAVGMGIFTMLILVPTIAIGLYGAVKYGTLPAAEFRANVLLHDQPPFIAAIVLVGLLAAATSTADSQLFALGSELRSLCLVKGRSPLIFTRIAIFCFGAAAWAFAIKSTDQLVSLALNSFKGTALLAPMVFGAVFCRRKLGPEIIMATGCGVALFLYSLVQSSVGLPAGLGRLPGAIAGIKFDLFLLMSLAIVTLLSIRIRSFTAQEA